MLPYVSVIGGISWSFLLMVSSLQYQTLTNRMYWLPLPIKYLSWYDLCSVETDVKTHINKNQNIYDPTEDQWTWLVVQVSLFTNSLCNKLQTALLKFKWDPWAPSKWSGLASSHRLSPMFVSLTPTSGILLKPVLIYDPGCWTGYILEFKYLEGETVAMIDSCQPIPFHHEMSGFLCCENSWKIAVITSVKRPCFWMYVCVHFYSNKNDHIYIKCFVCV